MAESEPLHTTTSEKRCLNKSGEWAQTKISGEFKEDEVMWLEGGYRHEPHEEVGSELLGPETGPGVAVPVEPW